MYADLFDSPCINRINQMLTGTQQTRCRHGSIRYAPSCCLARVQLVPFCQCISQLVFSWRSGLSLLVPCCFEFIPIRVDPIRCVGFCFCSWLMLDVRWAEVLQLCCAVLLIVPESR